MYIYIYVYIYIHMHTYSAYFFDYMQERKTRTHRPYETTACWHSSRVVGNETLHDSKQSATKMLGWGWVPFSAHFWREEHPQFRRLFSLKTIVLGLLEPYRKNWASATGEITGSALKLMSVLAIVSFLLPIGNREDPTVYPCVPYIGLPFLGVCPNFGLNHEIDLSPMTWLQDGLFLHAIGYGSLGYGVKHWAPRMFAATKYPKIYPGSISERMEK